MTGRRWALLFFVALGAWHLATVRFPFQNSDEAVWGDTFQKGHGTLWTSEFPREQKLVDHCYGFGLYPVQRLIVGSVTRAFGVGVAQVRLPSILFALAASGVLLLVMARLAVPWPAVAAVLLTMLSRVYFFGAHQCRPESLNLLVMSLALFWLFSGGGRLLGVLSGFFTALAWANHSNIVIFIAAFGLLVLWRERFGLLLQLRYYWWACGAAAGFLLVFHWLDVDSGAQFLQLNAGKAFFKPPLLQFKLNGLAVLRHLIRVAMNHPNEFYREWFPFFFAGALSSFWLALRWRRTVSAGEKSVTATAMALLLTFSLLVSSKTWHYQMYLEPWLFASVLLAARRLWRQDMPFDRVDLLALFGFTILVAGFDYGFSKKVFAAAACGTLALQLSARRLGFTRFGAGVVAAAGLAAATAAAFRWPFFLAHLSELSMPRLALLAAMMALIFSVDIGENGFRFGSSSHVPFGPVVALYLLVVVAGMTGEALWQEARDIRRAWRSDTRAALTRIQSEKRIIAPLTLWIERPDLPVQSMELLMGWSAHFPAFNPCQAFDLYQPTCIVWEDAAVPALAEQVRRWPWRAIDLERGESWVLDGRRYTEVRLVRRVSR